MARPTGGSARRVFQDYTDVYLSLVLVAMMVLLQATLLARLRVWGASPNLMLVAVISWSLVRGVEEGLLWGFVAGLGVDLVAGQPLGTSSLALMPVCFLANASKISVFASNLLLPILIVALATPVHGWIILLIATGRGQNVSWLAETMHVIGPELLLNAGLVILVYPMLRWLSGQVAGGKMEL